ncbi:MAG: hypothetical protein ACTSVI_15920 [Promethearchaeota archaeon]
MKYPRFMAISLIILSVTLSFNLTANNVSGFQVKSNNIPWGPEVGMAYTWNITKSSDSYMENTLIRLTISAIYFTGDQLGEETWSIFGSISRYFKVGNEYSWLTMKDNVTIARYSQASIDYELSHDAIADNLLILPINVQEPMLMFQVSYVSIINDSEWNISVDEQKLVYDAINKDHPLETFHANFSSDGMVQYIQKTNATSDVVFQMELISKENLTGNIDWILILIETLMAGAVILIVILFMLKRIKSKISPDNDGGFRDNA